MKQWRIVEINQGHCQITYVAKNSQGERIIYCLQDNGDQGGVRLLRCSQDGEPSHGAKLKEGIKAIDLLEMPTGDSRLEQLCRQWIENN